MEQVSYQKTFCFRFYLCCHILSGLNTVNYFAQVCHWCIPYHSICTMPLIHWGWVTHICVGKLTIIGSDNGLSPGRRQAIIGTNAGILLIGALGAKFNQILIAVHTCSFKKMHFKLSSAKWLPFCLGLNVWTMYCHLQHPIHHCHDQHRFQSLLWTIFNSNIADHARYVLMAGVLFWIMNAEFLL